MSLKPRQHALELSLFALKLFAAHDHNALSGNGREDDGLEVWADLKPKTGRVVVREMLAVPLLPMRVLEEKAEEKAT